MNPGLLSILRCPYCGGGFRYAAAVRPALGADDFGVLRCGCAAFPVVDGIPVLQKSPVAMYENTTGAAQVDGVPIAELVRLIDGGHPLEALRECLTVPAALPGLARRAMPWRVANGDAMRRMLRAVGKRRLSRDVLAHRHRLGARQVLEYFFPAGSPMGHAVGQYFILRFCQPRHLAALALLETLPSEEKPILDIACGLGHLEHYLASRERPAPVVGTDMNFFHVWIARHWFAPSAMFVCANAGEGLPFADDAFSASLCSDAYHYIPNRRDLLKHIERCAPGRPVFMTRVGNQAVMPNEGSEQSLQGYLEECGAQARSAVEAFGEGELVKAYLAGRNPLARAEAIPAGLDGEKWLSFSWNLDGAMRGAAPDQRVRPHAVGRIGINPIYRVLGRGKGKMRLRFEFPLPWYAYENHQMLSYHPRSAELPESDEGGLAPGRDWRGDAALAKLVDAYVLIGMPERFGPTPESPA